MQSFIYYLCDFKASQMNVERCLIREVLLYDFEVGHNIAETIKNIFRAKGEGAVDHSTVTK